MKWLQEVLQGVENAQELEKQINEKLQQHYVAKVDYNTIVKERDTLQQKYDTDTQNLQKQYQDSRKSNAIDMEIMKAKGKNAKAIKALLDMDKITLKDDGTLDGLDLEKLKKSDSYLFDIAETHIEGHDGGQKSGFLDNSDNLRSQIEHAILG